MIYIVSTVSAIFNVFLKTPSILIFFFKSLSIIKNKTPLSYPVNDQG